MMTVRISTTGVYRLGVSVDASDTLNVLCMFDWLLNIIFTNRLNNFCSFFVAISLLTVLEN